MKEDLGHTIAFIQATLERVSIHAGAIQAALDAYCRDVASPGRPLSSALRSKVSERELEDAVRDLARTRELIREWGVPPDTGWAVGCCYLYEGILSLGLLALRPGTPELYGRVITCLGEAISACQEHHAQAARVRQLMKHLFDEGVL